MTSWIWKSKILKFDFVKDKKGFWNEIKTFILVWQVLAFRLKKQTSNNVADTTFKVKSSRRFSHISKTSILNFRSAKIMFRLVCNSTLYIIGRHAMAKQIFYFLLTRFMAALCQFGWTHILYLVITDQMGQPSSNISPVNSRTLGFIFWNCSLRVLLLVFSLQLT